MCEGGDGSNCGTWKLFGRCDQCVKNILERDDLIEKPQSDIGELADGGLPTCWSVLPPHTRSYLLDRKRKRAVIDLTNDEARSIPEQDDEFPSDLDTTIIDLTDDDTLSDNTELLATATVISEAIEANDKIVQDEHTPEWARKPNECPIYPFTGTPHEVFLKCPKHDAYNMVITCEGKSIWACPYDMRFILFSLRHSQAQAQGLPEELHQMEPSQGTGSSDI